MATRPAVSAHEVAAVLATGAAHLVLTTWLHKQMVFTIAAILFWIAFVGVRVHRDRSVLRGWGFTGQGFWHGVRMLLPYSAVGLVATLGYGLVAKTLIFSWRFFLLLALYPAWGLVQQFLVVGLLAGNLRKGGRLPEGVIILVIAVLFAAIHLPSIPLVVVAGVMIAITTSVYFKTANLYSLGLFHGWIACLSYFFVLGHDPLADLLGGGIWP
jgi:hypothetical protein